MLQQILEPVLIALGTALASIITWLVAELIKWIKTKTKNETLNKSLTIAEEIVGKVVPFVNQTYVDQLKSDGKFDAKAQAEAFRLAVEESKKLIKPDIIKLINEVYGDFDEWLTVTIESIIKTFKK